MVRKRITAPIGLLLLEGHSVSYFAERKLWGGSAIISNGLPIPVPRLMLSSPLLVKKVSDVHGEEEGALTFDGLPIHVPCITEREINVADQFETNAPAGTDSRSAQSALCRPDRCRIEHRNRTHGEYIEIFEEGVQRPTNESDIVGRVLGCQRLIDGVEVFQ
jgi:hypothetical protein